MNALAIACGPATADRLRAHHRSRRHHPGLRPRPARRAGARQPHGHDPHHHDLAVVASGATHRVMTRRHDRRGGARGRAAPAPAQSLPARLIAHAAAGAKRPTWPDPRRTAGLRAACRPAAIARGGSARRMSARPPLPRETVSAGHVWPAAPYEPWLDVRSLTKRFPVRARTVAARRARRDVRDRARRVGSAWSASPAAAKTPLVRLITGLLEPTTADSLRRA